MKALALVLAIPLLAAAQEKPQWPSYRIAAVAKTKFMAPKKTAEFAARLKQIQPYAKLKDRGAIPDDTAGWERYEFEIAGESKFDLSILQRAFADIQIRKWELSLSGTATQDPQSKVIFVTSFGGKVKVKLLNRPRKDPNETVEDRVAKVGAEMDAGNSHFTVQGEIYSHGGTLSIYLESFEKTKAPPELPPDKK